MAPSPLESHPAIAFVRGRPMLLCFFALGVLNNVTYVIMIASSPEIAAHSIGIVYFSAIAPALLVKFSSQYWFESVSYSHRMAWCAFLMAVSFALVAFGSAISTKLLGVVCCSLQSALGEASCLALTTRFPGSERQVLLTGWSSGTGVAGIVGYVAVALFLRVLGLPLEVMLLSALLVLPIAWTYVYFSHIHGKFATSMHLEEADETTAMVGHGATSLVDRMRYLMPYSLPLFLVYFAEYACQSGVWITIGFPPTSEEARKQFYSASNTMYQLGVFLSRSSGTIIELALPQLAWLAVAQFAFMAFFIAVSALKIFYGWWLLVPAFTVGILGGACYVNAFRLLAQDSHPSVREKNMALTSTADSLGVGCADLFGIWLQRWLSG